MVEFNRFFNYLFNSNYLLNNTVVIVEKTHVNRFNTLRNYTNTG